MNWKLDVKIYSFKQLCQLILVPLNTLKTCKFPYFSSIQDSKLVHYIRKFVITELVIPIKFYKDLWRILPGTRKNFAMCETSLNPCSHYKRIYCMQWRMPKIPPQTITVSQRISEQPFLMVIQVYINIMKLLNHFSTLGFSFLFHNFLKEQHVFKCVSIIWIWSAPAVDRILVNIPHNLVVNGENLK